MKSNNKNKKIDPIARTYNDSLALNISCKKNINSYWKLLGIIPFFAGVAFNLIAYKNMKMNKTTVKPGKKSTILITV